MAKGGDITLTYENLLREVENEGVEIIEMDFQGSLKGLYSNNVIAISKSLSNDAEKRCVLAEELGHHYTSAGNILDQSKVVNRKQERKARAWAYDRLVGVIGLVNAYKHGCRSKYEMAEYLNVSERFLEDAITYYSEKYGPFYEIDNYILYFNPLGVVEKLE